MSDTQPPATPPVVAPTTSRQGAVVTSIVAQGTFFLALIASCVIAWVKGEYTLLTAMAGVAATNATTVVSYWVGSSDGSAKKTDQMAAQMQPPSAALSAAVQPTTGATQP